MRRLLLSIFLVTLLSGSLAATCQTDTDQNWERFRSIKEGFSVLFPEWPGVVNRGQYRSAPVRGARNYPAYADGVVYFLLSFDNPDHEKPPDYFLNTQLVVNELRNSEISAATEISNGSLKGKQYSLKKSDFRKSFSYPGVLRLYETKNRVLAQVAIGKDETDPTVERFLQSLEISEKPDGKDISSGTTYADSVASGDSPVMPNEVSRKVMILIKPEPQYTEEERQKKLRGGVVLKAVLSASGKVTNIQVVSGLPELAQSATEVARKIYFIPAVKDGRFISTFVELQYNFNIFSP